MVFRANRQVTERVFVKRALASETRNHGAEEDILEEEESWGLSCKRWTRGRDAERRDE